MEEKENNQAQKLQELFSEITNESETSAEQQEFKSDTRIYDNIDILNLPPRKEIHQRPKSKIYIRFHSPIFRFLFFLFIIILILLAIYFVVIDPFQLLASVNSFY